VNKSPDKTAPPAKVATSAQFSPAKSKNNKAKVADSLGSLPNMLNHSLSDAPDLLSLKLQGTDIVHLNIGGMTTLMTTVSVLTQCQESKLAKLF
jgi:hypothetical protein